MSIFRQYEELQREYISAIETHHNNQVDYSKLNDDDLDFQEEKIGILNQSLVDLRGAQVNYHIVTSKIIDASAISLTEANTIFSKLFNQPWKDCVVVETANDENFLMLQLDEYEENDILLGKQANNGLFHFYFPGFSGVLESFKDYNDPSPLIDHISEFVDSYIENMLEGKTKSWEEFFNDNYVYGDLISYSMRDLDSYEVMLKQDTSKTINRRRETYLNKLAKQTKFKIRTRKKLDEGKLPKRYGIKTKENTTDIV